MAKRRGGKKGKRYKNRKRVAAGKKAYRKSGLYKYNQRRKRGKKRGKRGHKRGKKYSRKHRGSKKSRKYERKASAAGVRVPPMSKIHDAYRRIIDRGGSEEHARAVVARLERMRKHAIHKGVEAHEAKMKAEAERKKAAEFADLFRKIGAEEHRRAHL